MTDGYVLLLALAFDALVGDPRQLPHPVVWFGKAIAWMEARWNHASVPAAQRRLNGIGSVALLVGGALIVGRILDGLVAALPFSWLFEAIVVGVFLAQRSLYDHVVAVARGLETGGLDGGRKAVALIVGRDPESLDEAGVARAAIESTAENYSDGVVAPALWYLVGGLPGIAVYKALNTADSMIGHKSDRYREFGWAAARADDVANWAAARLSALLIALAATVMPGAEPKAAFATARRDAGKHRSVNAGWPEAAMAGALGVRLAGPRRYAGSMVDDAWMGDGRADLGAADVRRAVGLYVLACAELALVVALVTLLP